MHLASKKLQENQALVDLHLEIKSVVYSAVQDFAGELSSPEAVIHHAFVQALPLAQRTKEPYYKSYDRPAHHTSPPPEHVAVTSNDRYCYFNRH